MLNFDKKWCTIQTSMKLLNPMAECQEKGKKDKLYYIECSFSCKTKKNLKPHESKMHCKKTFKVTVT